MAFRHIAVLALVGAGASLIGCERDERALGTERADRTDVVDVARMADAMLETGAANTRLAMARCSQEQRCNNIGADKKYRSYEACMESILEEKWSRLNHSNCRGGIVQKELAECLNEIRNEDCAAPFDALGRILACRASDMCNAVP